MKLLICTQTVDKNDPGLGFFVRWLEEFAKHCELVTVICLRKGEYDLPPHVRVFPLGKGGKISRAYKLLKGASKFRDNYDTVLVHMNPEYLVVAGWLWKLLHKKTALWYMHKSVNLKLRIAEKFADAIFTASKESFRLRSNKVHIMGHGIDTSFFSRDNGPRGTEVLSVGRLAKSKRHDLVIAAAQYMPREVWVAGDGPERAYLEQLAKDKEVASRIHLLGGRTQEELRELYRRTGVFAHTSETGSLDKVVLEALLCGLPVVSTSDAFKRLLERHSLFVEQAEPKALAAALERAQGKDIAELSIQVREEHSLQKLIPAILKDLA